MSAAPGDALVAISYGWGGPTIGASAKVERVTPTGIIVLDNGDRLKPSRFGSGKFEVRSSSSYSRTYVTSDHEDVRTAEANARARASARTVEDEYSAWKSDRDNPALSLALAEAARKHAEVMTP